MSLKTRIIASKAFVQILAKNISFIEAALWKETEQSLKTLPHVTCKQHKDCLFSYHE